jgi:hypothetical protein
VCLMMVIGVLGVVMSVVKVGIRDGGDICRKSVHRFG